MLLFVWKSVLAMIGVALIIAIGIFIFCAIVTVFAMFDDFLENEFNFRIFRKNKSTIESQKESS